MKKNIFILLAVALCVLILSRLDLDWSAIFHGQLTPALLSMRDVVDASGSWKYALFLFLFATLPLAFVPVSLLCLAGGLLFKPLPAVFLIWTGAVSSAALSFLLAKSLLRQWIRRHFLAKLEALKKLDEHAGEHGFAVCLFSRFVPWPYVFPGYAAGLTRIRFRDFLGASALAMLPWSVFYAVFSQGLAQGSPRELTMGLSILAVIFLATWLAKRRIFPSKEKAAASARRRPRRGRRR